MEAAQVNDKAIRKCIENAYQIFWDCQNDNKLSFFFGFLFCMKCQFAPEDQKILSKTAPS